MSLPPSVLRHHPEREPAPRRPSSVPRDAGYPTAADADDGACREHDGAHARCPLCGVCDHEDECTTTEREDAARCDP